MFGALQRILTFHWLITLVLMALLALVFGLMSFNQFMLLQANFALIAHHGAMALLEGALQQLLELVASGFVAVVCYVLIKACERVLVERILG